MLDLSLKNYVDWRVAQVIPVRSGFGYRVFLKYPDGSEKTQQKSGFKTEKEAVKARERPSQNYIMVRLLCTQRFMWLIL